MNNTNAQLLPERVANALYEKFTQQFFLEIFKIFTLIPYLVSSPPLGIYIMPRETNELVVSSKKL